MYMLDASCCGGTARSAGMSCSAVAAARVAPAARAANGRPSPATKTPAKMLTARNMSREYVLVPTVFALTFSRVRDDGYRPPNRTRIFCHGLFRP